MKKQKGPQSIKSAVLIVAAALVVWYGHSPAQAKEQTHTIGVLEERGKQQCLKRWEPTARYLNRAIPKREFKIIPLEYAELIPAAQNKSVDFILVNPGLYVELETGFGAQAIATLEALAFGKGYSKFGGVVFVLKNRAGIRHLKDIKGKTMMAVSRESFGGWVAMLREFKNIGIDPEKDCSSFQFGGTQDAVVDAVKNNTVEIGCVATSVLERMAAEGKIDIGDFRVIHEHEDMDTKEFKDFPFLHSTRIYPQWPLAKTKATDEKLSKAVTNALFSIEPDHLAAVTGEYFGWTNPLNYQPAHECLKELRLRPYREHGKVALGAVIRHYRAALSFVALLFLLLIAGPTVAGRLNQNLFKSQARLKQEMLERKAVDQKLLSKEAQYRTLFENSRSPIVILDNRGNYLNANKAALEFLECGPDELVTKNVKDYLAPGPAQDIISEHDKLGKRGGAIEAEYYVGGRIKVLELSFTPFIWKGKPAVIGIGKDISERRNTEKMIRESEAKFRRLTQELAQGQEATLNILEDLQEAKEALEVSRGNFMNIVENSADGITVVNHKNVILFINPAATKLFNQPAEQLLGTHLHFPVVTRETKEVEILADNQIVRMVEVKAAETRWGTEPAYIIVLHDITESKNAERALRLAAREWRTTFDAIGDGVAVLDKDGTILRCNKSLVELLDKDFKDILGQDGHQLMHAGQAKEEEKCIIRVMFENRKRETRIINIGKQWFSIAVDPLFDERKHLIGAVHIMRNITAQKNIENKLIEDTKFIENIVETAQAAIVVLNRNLEVLGVNNFCEHILRCKRDEIIGKSWVDVFVPLGYREQTREILTNCLAGSRVKGYEVPLLGQEGKETAISWHGAELKNAAGEIIGIVAMGYDITQRKEIEKVQRLAQLGTLISHMAHEVNNPLMIISGRAQIALAERIENKETERNIQMIVNECQRAKDIIQRLLRFSRPSKGEIKPMDINKSLDEVVSLVEHQFGIGNVAIKKHYQQELPQVFADERQLHEVFMNLLTNAKDAMENEGVIEITTAGENNQVRICFRDSGAGMSKDLIAKVFDPFFTTKEKGTGLGLSICYSIIKTHGGELYFDSEEGKGATVTILLPVEQETVN